MPKNRVDNPAQVLHDIGAQQTPALLHATADTRRVLSYY